MLTCNGNQEKNEENYKQLNFYYSKYQGKGENMMKQRMNEFEKVEDLETSENKTKLETSLLHLLEQKEKPSMKNSWFTSKKVKNFDEGKKRIIVKAWS